MRLQGRQHDVGGTAVDDVSTSTRSQRRKSVQSIISVLVDIMDSEINYRDSIPEQFAQRLEAAEYAYAMLEEAIACLEEAL